MLRHCTLLSLVSLMLLGCSMESPLTPATITRLTEPEASFAYGFTYDSCSTNTLNTSERTFQIVAGDVEPVTIPLTLSYSHMRAICQRAIAIDYFNYPETFRIQYDESDVVGFVTPASDYQITIRHGE